jgi:hypothetical protein
MEAKYILLGCFFLLFAGCASENQTQFVCSDNTTVSDPSTCPVGEISQQTWSSSNAYVCPDGSKVGSAIDCSECPSTCDDGNPCTSDICNQNTGFSCQHNNLNGPQAGCEGALTGCKERTCSSGSCTSQAQVPCCGNGKCEQGETCASCAEDCGCSQSASCCANICKEPSCVNDYDCDDGDPLTLDKCTGSGCEAICEHLAILSCNSGDGACPEGCNFLNDTDCPSFGVRQYGNVTEKLRAAIISKATRHCFGEGKDQGKDYGYFVILRVDFENTGLLDQLIPTNTFKVFTEDGKNYSSTQNVPGACDTSGMFAADEVRVLADKHTEGELWFELGKTELKCDFTAVLNKSAYGETGELIWGIPC